jgi:hypothetical protein
MPLGSESRLCPTSPARRSTVQRCNPVDHDSNRWRTRVSRSNGRQEALAIRRDNIVVARRKEQRPVLLGEVLDLNRPRSALTVASASVTSKAATINRRSGATYTISLLAVFTHSPGTAAIVEQTRRSWSGRVEMGKNLMVIDIGAEVRVRRQVAEVRPR